MSPERVRHRISQGDENGIKLLPVTPVLLYDGRCGFCAASVQFVLDRDPSGPLRFAALDSAFGRGVIQQHPELEGVDSMVWVEPADDSPGRVLVRSGAVLRVAEYLGGAWRLAMVLWLVPRPLRDAVYRVIARHRHRVARAECLVPTPAQRRRFLS